MRKTPSYLKGLAETRARACGDLDRYKKIYDEVADKITETKGIVESCDKLIRKFDSRLEPEEISAINAWKGRYGKRGALVAAISRLIRDVYPNDLTTIELRWLLQLEFQLDFPTPQSMHRWHENSLRPAIGRVFRTGVIERVRELPSLNGAVGRWRWKSDASLSVDHLLAQAAAAGVSIQEADDDPE